MRDDALLARVERDWRSAGLDPRRAAILAYVEKLTRTPAQVTREDVDALGAQGLSDSDVLAVCEVAAYYAYANRIADGLGVSLEPWVGGEGEGGGGGGDGDADWDGDGNGDEGSD